MKVYLASRYSTKDLMNTYAQELRASGIEVTSTWLEETHGPNTQLQDVRDEELAGYAEADLRDVYRAEWLVFFSVDPTIPVARGGRHVEFGYALGLGRKILVVGPKENIFHYLPEIHFVNNFEEAKEFLLRAE
jgi:hypothetical protein